jgi:putative membrane protein
MQLEEIKGITRPDPKLLTLYIVQCCLTLVFAPLVFLPLFFKYHTLRYAFTDEGITMAWGLLWRREIVLTYARIQDIHVSRGLIERWLGLGTVHIQTAAGSSGPEMSIVGLTCCDALRDFLYSRMRGARFGHEGPAHGADAAADPTVALLTEIRDEIRALGERLGGAPRV